MRKPVSAFWLIVVGWLVLLSHVAVQAADLEISKTAELSVCHGILWLRDHVEPGVRKTWDWQPDESQWQQSVREHGGKKQACTFALWVPQPIAYVKGLVVISGHGSGEALYKHPQL